MGQNTMENGYGFEMDYEMTLRKPYNMAYLNMSLLDELDYVIGGYGKPNQAFIYTLNSFIESYVLNETFFFSVLEWNHYMLTNKSILTKGRPIREILFRKGDAVVFQDWTGQIKSKILYAKPVVEGQDDTQFCIDDFQRNAIEEVQNTFFKPAIFLEPDQEYSYLTRNFGWNKVPEKTYIIYDVKRTPTQILEGLYQISSNDNVQIAMPFNGLKAQLRLNRSMLPSNQSLKLLSDLHHEKIEKLSKYTGYKKIPIPPLVSILLSQCRSLQDIPLKLRQLRADFTALRNTFTELERKIDKAENHKEMMDAVDEVESFWRVFNKKYNSGNHRLIHQFWDLIKTSGVDDATEKVLDTWAFTDFLSNLNATSILGKAGSKALTYFKDRRSIQRFKGMTDLWELLQKSPTLENQAKDYERIFKVKIDLKELNNLHQIARS